MASSLSSPPTPATAPDTSTSKSVRLFSFGSNSLGQLALGHVDDAHTPSPVLLPPVLPTDITIVAGGNHTFLLSHAQKVIHATGDNAFGQCAVPPQSTPTKTFTPVPPPSPTAYWTSVSAGWQFSILLSSDGNLYACGNGPRGELGLGESITTSPTPTLIPSFLPPDVTVVQLASSVEHTLVLVSDGTVYGWGNGRKGQLGTLPTGEKHLWRPTKLQINLPDFHVAGIAAGRDFSAFISRSGVVHVIGSDKWSVITSNLTATSKVADCRVFSAGWGAIYVLRRDGTVVSWGRNTHGQLPPEGMPPLDSMAVGSEHAVAVGRDGKLYAWGWGEHGNCGPLEGKREVVKSVQEVKLGEGEYRVEGIAAGCATSWVWASEVD
ncbi:hypothetical protein Dda_2165 [Drechslerella dactyloides]|uniref:RCC1-like domain-containing protein n=1 Tax=Drechslerella dactyloides TaxID=74499 RepID=A0AAD6J4D8_DREDA|nr:hypothetical protein Dda_2165 [Drechslerella dactyloides]